MENELVHHHDFHSIQFQNFNIKERNVIYALCYKVMNQGTDLLEFSVKEIETLANYTPRGKGDNVYKLMEEVYDRVKNASIKIKKENGIKAFVLFTKFETFEDKGIIQIKVNEEYRYLLNELAAPFTIQNIIEYSKLTSGYSQLAYSFLKKWEGTKKIKISIIEFRELLGVPESYDSSDFNKRVLSYLEKELPNYFSNLKIEKIKTGRKVTHLNFDWKSKPIISNKYIIDITISQDIQEAFEKALKNRFIKEFLTEEKKHKLIASFDEKDLIRGLKYAKDNINYSFKTFSYLENSIKKGLEKPIVKTTIVKTNNLEEKNIILGEQLSIKTKVTRKEYEECYQEYLKSNNKKNGKEIRASWEFSVKTKFEIIEENKDVENDKDQFPPNDFSKFEKEKTKMEYPPLEECSPQTQELAAKLKKKREEFEKLNSFSKEILLSIIKLKTEISSAGFFSKKMLENELINFEQKSQEWHWLFAGLEYKTLSLDNLKYFNELTKYFEEKLGIIISNTVIEQCINHMQESPVNIEGNNLSSDTLKNLISIKDIPEEKLLSKNGKKLVGGALTSRLKKLAKELEENIQLENGELISV